jgi:copper homeostasis protein CutC
MGKREEKKAEQAFDRLRDLVQIRRNAVAIVAGCFVRGEQNLERLKETVDELDEAEALLAEAQRRGNT